ncbi:MAG: hypothetical protein ACTSUO_09195 [Candidatus Thorarchaeota archaeon]
MKLDPSLAESDTDPARLRIERLGSFVTPDQCKIFDKILRTTSIPRMINVTGWTRDGVRILLTVLRDLNRPITIRSGDKYFTPIAYPRGAMFEALVLTISEGEPWLVSDVK